MKEHVERTRRMRDQKWIIDKMIQVLGVESCWPMINRLLNTAGLDLNTDIMDFKSKVKRYSDIPKELIRIAKKREMMARRAEDDGHLVTARDNYFSASACYILAQTAVPEDDLDRMTEYNTKKNECYDNFMRYSPHPVERVEIPFEDRSLPGFLHLPKDRAQEVPCIIDIGGTEILKEILLPLYNNKILERGMAVLAFDGPGQGDARLRGITLGGDRFIRAGRAVMDFLIGRKEIDPEKVGIRGFSMGSRVTPIIVANDHRFKAAAVHGSAFETRGAAHDEAIPLIKPKVMWMQGIDDEEEFDRLTRPKGNNPFKRIAADIRCPFLIIAGEDDTISPIEYTYDFYNDMTAPKKLVVYEGQGHEIRHTYDVDTLIADWLKDRMDGRPMDPEIIYVDSTGRESRR